jgi:hypothetical protein
MAVIARTCVIFISARITPRHKPGVAVGQAQLPKLSSLDLNLTATHGFINARNFDVLFKAL